MQKPNVVFIPKYRRRTLHVTRHVLRKERNYAGQHLWARGYFVDTEGRGTERIRRYTQQQEAEDKRLDQREFPAVTNQKPQP